MSSIAYKNDAYKNNDGSTHKQQAYAEEIWNDYSRAHLAVMPSEMLVLNKAVAKMAKGNVVDFGCGTAKIAPFVLDNSNVSSYTGIDYSKEMVEQARWHLSRFPEKPGKIICGKIEAMGNEAYDFGLSTNSYYAWENPLEVLRHIYAMLGDKGELVLVTPNKSLDMANLLHKAERELVAHPYFQTFKDQNMSLVGNEKALFIDMDVLVDQVRQVGFKVIEAHQQFYQAGLNYLYLKK
jgi:SAM-dependent methyltransferase